MRRRSNALTPGGVDEVAALSVGDDAEAEVVAVAPGWCACFASLRRIAVRYFRLFAFERAVLSLVFWYFALIVAAQSDTSAINLVYILALISTTLLVAHREVLKRCAASCCKKLSVAEEEGGESAVSIASDDAGAAPTSPQIEAPRRASLNALDRGSSAIIDSIDMSALVSTTASHPGSNKLDACRARGRSGGIVLIGVLAASFFVVRLVYGAIVSELPVVGADTAYRLNEPCTRVATRSLDSLTTMQLVMCSIGLTSFTNTDGSPLWTAVAPALADALVAFAALVLTLARIHGSTYAGSFTQEQLTRLRRTAICANYVRDHGRILLRQDVKRAWVAFTDALGGGATYVALCIALIVAGCAQPSVLCFPFFAASISAIIHIIVGNLECCKCAVKRKAGGDASGAAPTPPQSVADEHSSAESPRPAEGRAGSGVAKPMSAVNMRLQMAKKLAESRRKQQRAATSPLQPSSVQMRMLQARALHGTSPVASSSSRSPRGVESSSPRRGESRSPRRVGAASSPVLLTRRPVSGRGTMSSSTLGIETTSAAPHPLPPMEESAPADAPADAPEGAPEVEGEDSSVSGMSDSSSRKTDAMNARMRARRLSTRCASAVAVFGWIYSIMYFVIIWVGRCFLMDSTITRFVSTRTGVYSSLVTDTSGSFVRVFFFVALVHVLSGLALGAQRRTRLRKTAKKLAVEKSGKHGVHATEPRYERGSILVVPHFHGLQIAPPQWGECEGVFSYHTFTDQERPALERSALNLECTYDRGAQGRPASEVDDAEHNDDEGTALSDAEVKQRLIDRSVQMYAWRWKRLQENFVQDLVWETRHMKIMDSAFARKLPQVHGFFTFAEHKARGEVGSLWEEIIFFETRSVSVTATVMYDVTQQGSIDEQRTQVLRYFQATLYKVFASTIFLALAFTRPSLLASVYLLVVSIGLMPSLYNLLYGWRSMVVCLMYTAVLAFAQYAYAVGSTVYGKASDLEVEMGIIAEDSSCVHDTQYFLSWTTLMESTTAPTAAPTAIADNSTATATARCLWPVFLHLRDGGLSSEFGSSSAYLSILGIYVLACLAMLAKISLPSANTARWCCPKDAAQSSIPGTARLQFRLVVYGQDILTWTSVYLQRYKVRRALVLFVTFLAGVFPTPSPLRFMFMVLFVCFCLPVVGAALSVIFWGILELTCAVSVLAAYTWNFEVVANAFGDTADEWSLNRPTGTVLMTAMVLPSIVLLLAEGSDRHLQNKILRRALIEKCILCLTGKACKKKKNKAAAAAQDELESEHDRSTSEEGLELTTRATAEGGSEAEGDEGSTAAVDAPHAVIEEGGDVENSPMCVVFRSACDYTIALAIDPDTFREEGLLEKTFVHERIAALETEYWMRDIAMRNVHREVSAAFDSFMELREQERIGIAGEKCPPFSTDDGGQSSRICVALERPHPKWTELATSDEWDQILWQLDLLRIFYHASIIARFPITPLKSRFGHIQGRVVTEQHLSDLFNWGETECTWDMFFNACEGLYHFRDDDTDESSEDSYGDRSFTALQMCKAFETLVVQNASPLASLSVTRKESEDAMHRPLWTLDLDVINFETGRVKLHHSHENFQCKHLFLRYKEVYELLLQDGDNALKAARSATKYTAEMLYQMDLEVKRAIEERGAIQMVSTYTVDSARPAIKASHAWARPSSHVRGSAQSSTAQRVSSYGYAAGAAPKDALALEAEKKQQSVAVFKTRLRDGRVIRHASADAKCCSCVSRIKHWFDREMLDVTRHDELRRDTCIGRCRAWLTCDRTRHMRQRTLVVVQHLEVDLVFVRALEMGVLIMFVALSFILAIVQAIGESFPALIWLFLVCFMLVLLVFYNADGEDASPIRKSLKSIAHWNKWLAFTSGAFLLVTYATKWEPVRNWIDEVDMSFIHPVVRSRTDGNSSLLIFTATRGQSSLVSDTVWEVGNHSFLFASASIFLYLYQLLGLRKEKLFDEVRDKEHLNMQTTGSKIFGLVKNGSVHVVNLWSNVANVVCSSIVFIIAINNDVLSLAGAAYMFIAIAWCVAPLVPARWLRCAPRTVDAASLRRTQSWRPGARCAQCKASAREEDCPRCAKCGRNYWRFGAKCLRGSLCSAPVLGAFFAIVCAHGAYLLQFDWRIDYIDDLHLPTIFTKNEVVQWRGRDLWATNTSTHWDYYVNVTTSNGTSLVHIVKDNFTLNSGSTLASMDSVTINSPDLAAPIVILCLAALLSLGRHVKVASDADTSRAGKITDGSRNRYLGSFVDFVIDNMDYCNSRGASQQQKEYKDDVKRMVRMVEHHILQLDEVLCTLTWTRELATAVLLGAALTHISVISIVYMFIAVLLYHPVALGLLGPSLKMHQWAPIIPLIACIFYQYCGLVMHNGVLTEAWASWLGLKQAGGRVDTLYLDWIALMLLTVYMRMLPYLRTRYDGRTDINAVQTEHDVADEKKEGTLMERVANLPESAAEFAHSLPTIKEDIATARKCRFETAWNFATRPASRQHIQRRVPGKLFRVLYEERNAVDLKDAPMWSKKADPIDLIIMRLLNHRRDEVGTSREFVKWKKRVGFDECRRWIRCTSKSVEEHTEEEDDWVPHEEDFMKRCATPQDIIAYCLFGLYPHLALAIVFILGTINFNIMSVPYVALPLFVVMAQPYGVFCGLDTSYSRVARIYFNPHYAATAGATLAPAQRWKKKDVRAGSSWQCWRKWWSHSAFQWWYALWMYSVFAIAFRILMQMPSVTVETTQDSYAVLLGLRPVYSFEASPNAVPARNEISSTRSHLIAVDGAVFCILLVLNGVLSLKHVCVVLVANWRMLQDMAVRNRKLNTDRMEGQHQLLMRLSKHRTESLKAKVAMFELTEAGAHSQYVKNFERQYLSFLTRSRKRALESGKKLAKQTPPVNESGAEGKIPKNKCQACCSSAFGALRWRLLQRWEKIDIGLKASTGGGVLKLLERFNSLHLVIIVILIKVTCLDHTVISTCVVVFVLFSVVLVSNPCGWQPLNPNFGASDASTANAVGSDGDTCRIAVSSSAGDTVISASGTLSSASRPSVQLWQMRDASGADGANDGVAGATWGARGFEAVDSVSPKQRHALIGDRLGTMGDELDDKDDNAEHVDHISAVSVSRSGNRAVSVGHDGMVIAYETASQRKADRDAEIEVITKFERHTCAMLLAILDIVPQWWVHGDAAQHAHNVKLDSTAESVKAEDDLWRALVLQSNVDESRGVPGKSPIECDHDGSGVELALAWVQRCPNFSAAQRRGAYALLMQNIDDRRRLRRALARCTDEVTILPASALKNYCVNSLKKVCASLLKNIRLDFEIGSGSRIFDPPFFRDLCNGPVAVGDVADEDEWGRLVAHERHRRRRVEWYRGNVWRGHQFSTRDAERAARRATELEDFCEWSLITRPGHFDDPELEVGLLAQDYCVDLRHCGSMESSARSLFAASPPRWLQPRFQNEPVESTMDASSLRLDLIAWFHGDKPWSELYDRFTVHTESKATEYEQRAMALVRVIFREGPRRRFYREHYMHAWVEIEVKHGINLIAPQLLAMTGSDRALDDTLQTQIDMWIHGARERGIWSELEQARNVSRGGRHSGRAYTRGCVLNKAWLLDIFWEFRDLAKHATRTDGRLSHADEGAHGSLSYSTTCSFRAVHERLQKHRSTLANLSKTLAKAQRARAADSALGHERTASGAPLSVDDIVMSAEATVQFERRTVRRLYDEQTQEEQSTPDVRGANSANYSRSRNTQASLNMFDCVDRDGDGQLTVEELMTALEFDKEKRGTVDALIKLADDGKVYSGEDTPTLTREEFTVLIAFIDSITSTQLVLDSPADAAKRIRHGMVKYKKEQLTSPPRVWLDAERGSEVYATFNDVVNLFLHRNRVLISASVTEEQRAKHVKMIEDVAEKLMVSFCTVFAMRPDDYGSSVRASMLRALQDSDAAQATPEMEAALAVMETVDGMRQPRPAYRAYRNYAAMLVSNHACKVTRWAAASDKKAPAGSSMEIKRLYKAAQMSPFPLRRIVDFLLPEETTSDGDELEVISAKQLSDLRKLHSLPRIGRTGLLRVGKEYSAMSLLLKQIQYVGEDLREIGNIALDSARVLQRLQKRQSGWIVAVAMTPDGRRIVFASDTGALYEHTFLFDSSGKHMHMYSEQEEKGRIPIALNCWRDQKSDEQRAGKRRSRASMFETEPQRIVQQIKQRGSEVSEQRNLAITAIALTRNGRYVACCDRSGWLHVLHQRLDERRTDGGGRNNSDVHGRWTHVGKPEMHSVAELSALSMEQSSLQAVNAVAIIDCDAVKTMLHEDSVSASHERGESNAAVLLAARDAARRGFIVITCGLDNNLVLWKVIPGVGEMGTGVVTRLWSRLVTCELAVSTIRVHPQECRFWTGHEVQMLMEWELVCLPDHDRDDALRWDVDLKRCWPGAIHSQHFSFFDTCEHGLVVGGAQKNGHKFFAWNVAESDVTNSGKARVLSCSVAPREGDVDDAARAEEARVEKDFDKHLVELFASMHPTVKNGREVWPRHAPELKLRAMRTRLYRKPVTRRIIGLARRGDGDKAQGAAGSGAADTRPDLHVLWFLQQKMILDNHLIMVKDNAYNFRKMRRCFEGQHVVNWLVRPNGLHLDLDDAILVGNLMWQYGLIDLVDPTAECHQWKKFTQTLSVAQKSMIDQSVGDQMQSLEASIAFEKSCKGGLWFDDLDLQRYERTVWPLDKPRTESKPHMLGLSKLPFRAIGEGAYYSYVQLHLRRNFVESIKATKGKTVTDSPWAQPRYPRIFPEVPHMHGLSDSHIVHRLTRLLADRPASGAALAPHPALHGVLRGSGAGDDAPLAILIARELKRVTEFAEKRKYFFSNESVMGTGAPSDDSDERAGLLESLLVRSDPEQWVHGRGEASEGWGIGDDDAMRKQIETWREVLRDLMDGIAGRCGTRKRSLGGSDAAAELHAERKSFDKALKSAIKELEHSGSLSQKELAFTRAPCAFDLYLFAATVRLGDVGRQVVTHRGSNDDHMRDGGRKVVRAAALAIVSSLGGEHEGLESAAPGTSRMLRSVASQYARFNRERGYSRVSDQERRSRMRAFAIAYFITDCTLETWQRDDEDTFKLVSPWSMWWQLATFSDDEHGIWEQVRGDLSSLFGVARSGTSFSDLVAKTVDDCQANRVQLESGVPALVQLLQLFDSQVQNPPRLVWIGLLLFSIGTLLLRFTWQMPIFCDCFGVPRMYPFCVTAPAERVSRMCAKSWYGNGDRSLYLNYVDQEFGASLSSSEPDSDETAKQNIDISYQIFGLDKTPRLYFSEDDVGGVLSDSTLRHGNRMEFIFSTIAFSDIMMVAAIIFHIASLQRQGLWQMPSRHMGADAEPSTAVLRGGRLTAVSAMWVPYFKRMRWAWQMWVKNLKWSVVPQRQRYGNDLYQMNQLFLLFSIVGLVLHKSRLWSGILKIVEDNAVNFETLAIVLVYAVFFLIDRVTYLLRNDIMKMVLHHVMVIVFIYQVCIAIPVVEQGEGTTVVMNRHTLDSSTWWYEGDEAHPLANAANADLIWGYIFNSGLAALDLIGLGWIFGTKKVIIPSAAARVYEMYLFFALPMCVFCFSLYPACLLSRTPASLQERCLTLAPRFFRSRAGSFISAFRGCRWPTGTRACRTNPS
jgi:hypothetical protein